MLATRRARGYVHRVHDDVELKEEQYLRRRCAHADRILLATTRAREALPPAVDRLEREYGTGGEGG